MPDPAEHEHATDPDPDPDPGPDSETADGAAPGRWLTVAMVVCASIAVVSGLTYVDIVVRSRADAVSPEDASQRFIDTAQQDDPIRVVDLLPDDEQAPAQASRAELTTQLHRLGILTTPDGHHPSGVSIATDSLRRTTQMLGPGIVAVDLTAGQVRLSAASALPTEAGGDHLLADGYVLDAERTHATRDFATAPLRIVAIATGDNWRISLAYSVAENLKGHPTVSRAAPAPPVDPVGAAAPPDAVRDLLDAYAGADPDRAQAHLLPREADALYDFSALFMPPDPKRITVENQNQDPRTLPIDVRLALRPTGTFNRLELQAAGDGDQRQIRITALDYTIDREVQIEHLTYDGSCLTAEYRFAAADPEPYARFNSCTGAPAVVADPDRATTTTADPDRATTTTADPDRSTTPADPDRAVGTRRPPRDNVFSTLAIFGTGGQLPDLTVATLDGKWFVSPVRSMTSAMVATLERTEPDQHEPFLTSLRALTLPDTSQAAKETTDPDNSLFGPRAVAANRLLAACFVEVMDVVGEESSADPSIECITHLAAADKVRTDAVAPMLLGACYHAEPITPPADANPYRRLYLARAATRACFQKAVEDGIVPSYTVTNHLGREQGCFTRYEDLDRTGPEATWAAADIEVKTCVDRELQRDPAARTTDTPPDVTPTSVDPGPRPR